MAHNQLEKNNSLKNRTMAYITKNGTHFQVYCASKVVFKLYV